MRLFAAIILLSLCTVCQAGPVQVHDAQLKEMPDGTQLILHLSAPAKHASFTLDNPPRLVLDLSDTRLGPSRKEWNLRSADVQAVRTGIRTGVDLRIVLDLAGAFRHKAYLLPPTAGGNRHQLVVDVFRGGASKARPTPAKRTSATAAATQRNIVIAIDPGHGGKDPGAIGPNGTREKDVVLQIARRLRDVVNREPGMRAVLTRNGDTYLPLLRRIRIAREHQADMFISIHADAYTHPHARGSSIFMLSTKGASSMAARWLADRENAADLIGGVSLGDKDDQIASVLLDLSQEATLEASMELADKVLGQLRKVGDVHKRAVERAGFMVLKSPDVPSILVETAFITNPQEEARLGHRRHQQALAQAIMNGVRDYYRQRLPHYLMVAEAPAAQPPAEPEAKPVAAAPAASLPQRVAEAAAQPPTQPTTSTTAPAAEPASSPPAAAAPALPRLDLVSTASASQPLPDLDLISTASPRQPLPDLDLVSRAPTGQPPPKLELVSTAPANRPPEPAPRRVHVIQRGESLFDIAVRYRVSLPRLRAVNGLSSKQLRMPAGTRLTIPVQDS